MQIDCKKGGDYFLFYTGEGFKKDDRKQKAKYFHFFSSESYSVTPTKKKPIISFLLCMLLVIQKKYLE
ncbi:MAG TPA: hypothetical protein DHU78_03190 [Opitutae bacterium]|nr:hypothetical protein [Opitutae bacterium]|tara:strand:+ start:1732 stop:1935 length:204 start_codon:yes stop_codon:yes gene_type:complete